MWWLHHISWLSLCLRLTRLRLTRLRLIRLRLTPLRLTALHLTSVLLIRHFRARLLSDELSCGELRRDENQLELMLFSVRHARRGVRGCLCDCLCDCRIGAFRRGARRRAHRRRLRRTRRRLLHRAPLERLARVELLTEL